MAKFEIYLLNLRGDVSEFSSYYSFAPISSFVTKYQENNITASFKQEGFTYTFDEKFELHSNAQKKLSFSMAKNIIRADRMEINPFINYLFIGTQLLLIDKHDKHHLMTITDISYDFNKSNTIFKYECQDSFSYQLSRQDTKYEITNNVDDVDFIGARSLDWWVLCKIHPDCNIAYSYLKLNDSRSFKPQYDNILFSEFYKTIPFSGSGTANSMLISLGELFGLQLQVYERLDLSNSSTQGRLEKYYWFEPIKNPRPSGLKYSPNLDLQSFGLQHKGVSCSSVLNVSSHNIGNSLVTLLPSVPNFFRQWFESKEWAESKFISGMYSSACQENTTQIIWNDEKVEEFSSLDTTKCQYKSDNHLLYIPLNIHILSQYNYISFTTKAKDYSNFIFTGLGESSSYFSKNSEWEIIGKTKKGTTFSIWSNRDLIPQKLIQEEGLSYLYLRLPADTSGNVLEGRIYIVQYRIPTTEEIEFAEIADQVPWLENKLIDFRYFSKHKILSELEHSNLMSILQNDMRKANAKLLLYSQSYYQSIQYRTEEIGRLSAKIDRIGAEFNDSLINPLWNNDRTRKTTELELALSDLFQITSNSTLLITYYDIVKKYVNQYFNAEQSFLKNVYLFKTYFNTHCNFGILKTHSFIANNSSETEKISFKNKLDYVKMNGNNYFNNIYLYEDGEYSFYDRKDIISLENYQKPNFFYLNNKATKESATGSWVKDNAYYEKQWECDNKNILSGSVFLKVYDVKINNVTYKIQVKRIANSKLRISCYMHCLFNPVQNEKIVTTGGVEFTNLTEVYEKVSSIDIKKNYFYQTLKETSEENKTELAKENFYRRINLDYQSINISNSSNNWLKNFADSGMKPKILQYNANFKNEESGILKGLFAETDGAYELANAYYQQFFPLTNLYWKGKKEDSAEVEYHSVPFVTYETCNQFYRRISCGNSQRTWNKILSWSSAAGALIGWILRFGWKEGTKSFGNDGWTLHDVFNFNLENADPFQRWYDGDQIVYITNAEAYDDSNQRNVFDNKYYNNDKDTLNKDAQILDSKWTYKEATNFLFTYRSFTKRLSATSAGKYYYKATYWRLLNQTDYVSLTETLYLILQKDKEVFDPEKAKLNTITFQGKSIDRLNTTVYYPLQNILYPVTVADFLNTDLTDELKKQGCIQISELLSKNFDNRTWNGYLFSGTLKTDPTLKGTMIILREEDFDYQQPEALIKNNQIQYDMIQDWNIDKLYTSSNDTVIDVSNYSDFTEGFFVVKNEEDYISTQLLLNLSKEELETYDFYEKVNNSYVKKYTLQQLSHLFNSYVCENSTYTINTFGSEEEFRVSYFTYTKDSENKWTLGDEKIGVIIKNEEDWVLKTDSANINLNHTMEDYDLNQLSFGSFWYTYQNSNIDILAEKARLIETNLSEYWLAAYQASLQCRFFLPEYWQPIVNNKTNPFSSEIILPSKENSTIKTISANELTTTTTGDGYSITINSNKTECEINLEKELQNFYITCLYKTNYPFVVNIQGDSSKTVTGSENTSVEVEVSQSRNRITIKTNRSFVNISFDISIKNSVFIDLSSFYLPNVKPVLSSYKYQLQHRQENHLQENIRMYEETHNLTVDRVQSLQSLISTNAWADQIVQYLDLNVSDWSVQEIPYQTTYYEYLEGGTFWTDMLTRLSNGLIKNSQFGGWCDMMIRVLQSGKYRNDKAEEYFNAQEDHNRLWRQIYIKYPNILYEQPYTNESATNSKELLDFAQYAFKDYLEPESAYSTSVINTNTLRGYKGEELKIGDAIEIEAREIYDDPGSDIYRSLNQYLYITDISYDLRRDDNIQLTINDIKYQDKVIGQLIKLIR